MPALRNIIIILFLFSTMVFADNSYIKTLGIKGNPAINSFKNYSEVGGFYNNKNKDYGFYLGTPICFTNIYLSSEYNKELDELIYSWSTSIDLGDYFGIGWSNYYYKEHYFGSLGFVFRLPYLYLGYNYTFNSNLLSWYNNHSKHSIQFGTLLFGKISPFFNIRQFGDNYNNLSDWSYDIGVTLLHLYGFSLTYQYTREWNKNNIHQISLQFDLPYFNMGGELKNGEFTNIYASFHLKRNKNTVFEASNYWLKIKLNGKLSEIGKGGVINGSNYSFLDLVTIIKKAVNDDYIKGIFFEIDKPSLSSSQAEELLNLLKKSNKKYRVYLKSNSLGDYLLATASEESAIHPAVDLNINGANITIMFYKNLLAILGVKAYFFKRGNYKSAPESFTESAPSKYNLEELNKIVKIVKNLIETTITNNKKLTNIEDILNNAPYPADKASKLSLVNKVAYLDDFENELKLQGVEFITSSLYNSMFLKSLHIDKRTNIAILAIDGEITENKGIFLGISENYREKILNSIQEIKRDPSIDAVIVRVNSPGGSGFVSDEINHAIKVLKKYKPVYVSIGNMSASGGYYISVAGDKIFANKMSIVGSIGVFTGKFVLQGIIGKFMVNVFTKSIWENGNLNSMYNLLTEKQIKKMDDTVSDFYEIFLSRVNEGRGIDIKKLKNEIAGGRIYMGEESKKLHLIDEIGGFNDTLNALIKDNGYSNNVKLYAYPKNDSLLLSLLSGNKKLLFKLNTIMNLLNTPNLLLSDYDISF